MSWRLSPAMPSRRSYFSDDDSLLTDAQRRRRARDLLYRTAHSAPGKRFIEVDSKVVQELKAMAAGKAVHHCRDVSNGFPSNRARNASLWAAREGHIGPDELAADLRTFAFANAGKHVTSGVGAKGKAAASSPRIPEQVSWQAFNVLVEKVSALERSVQKLMGNENGQKERGL